MGLTYTAVVVVILLFSRYSVCVPGDPVMYLPPFEVRTLGNDNNPNFLNAQFQPLNQMVPVQQQSILHTTLLPTQSPTPPTVVQSTETKSRNFTFSDIVEALNHLENKEEDRSSKSRAAARDYDYPPYSSYPGGYRYPRPYSYPQRPNYGSWNPSSYSEPPSAYVPPIAVHHAGPKKPEFSGILKPVTTKVASKLSGLIGLVLALFTGSAPDDLELKGFKDIVINGIVKPLLIAKGGIKSLISKLTIPVISLLLINLEVLITIWWLWEECPEPVQPPPVYSYPKPAYTYNSNSYK